MTKEFDALVNNVVKLKSYNKRSQKKSPKKVRKSKRTRRIGKKKSSKIVRGRSSKKVKKNRTKRVRKSKRTNRINRYKGGTPNTFRKDARRKSMQEAGVTRRVSQTEAEQRGVNVWMREEEDGQMTEQMAELNRIAANNPSFICDTCGKESNLAEGGLCNKRSFWLASACGGTIIRNVKG